jgi:hypothetical protein
MPGAAVQNLDAAPRFVTRAISSPRGCEDVGRTTQPVD